jgi:hypothetical protein
VVRALLTSPLFRAQKDTQQKVRGKDCDLLLVATLEEVMTECKLLSYLCYKVLSLPFLFLGW